VIIKKLFAIGAVIAGTVAATAGVAAASAGHPASVARPAAAQHTGTARGGPGGEDPSHESDGPGGHQDPAGQDVNHQFQGAE
jgi:hypothetical protein